MTEAGQLTRMRGASHRASASRFWSGLLWSLIYPRQRQRTMPTISGVLLMLLSFGIGTAAYNAGNNILFITLSLLLACLVLSGVLSWLNFRRVGWRLRVAAPWRVGHEAVVTLALRNTKTVLPTYGLWFELVARSIGRDAPAKAETTFTAKGAEVRAAIARSEAVEARETLSLRARLNPQGETEVDWVFKPQRRGVLRVELVAVGSLFPFGFLKKSFATDLAENAIVWPAAVEYRRFPVGAARQPAGGERVARMGTGSDLLALRRYELGDSHRLIHWKASARTRRLLVRQFAAESVEGFALWVRTTDHLWRPEQFELMLSLAATLAEDLFRAGKLTSVALDAVPPTPVRRVRDLEAFLDELATVKEVEQGTSSVTTKDSPPAAMPRRRNLVTFTPDGPRGVMAVVEGQTLAAV